MENQEAQPDSQVNTHLNPANWKATLKKNKKPLIIGGIVVLLVVLVTVFFIMSGKRGSFFGVGSNGNSSSTGNSEYSNNGSNSSLTQKGGEKPEGAIAKVGEEYIFKRDLDYELTFQPGEKTDELKKILVNKLVQDSVALQAAQKEKIINLGKTEFNLEAKDYQRRIELLNSVKKTVDSRIDHIAGTIVSVWFYNMKPAKIGLEQGKQEAFKKISALRAKVVSGDMTIEEAGESIKKDSSYANLDFGYVNNALVQFNFTKGKRITFDKQYDEILWKTDEGALTDVFLGKTINEFTNKEEEAFYLFGLVKEKVDKGNSSDYIKWVEEQKKNYEVTIY